MKLLVFCTFSFMLLQLGFAQNQDEDKISSLFCGLPLNESFSDIIESVRLDEETFQIINEEEQSFAALIKEHPVMDFQGENMVMTIFHPHKKMDRRFNYGIWIDANFGMDAREQLFESYDKLKASFELQANRIEEKDIEYYDYSEGQTLSIFLTEKSKYPEIEIEWFITLPGIHYLKIEHKHYTNLQ